jgi:hypothetical protein
MLKSAVIGVLGMGPAIDFSCGPTPFTYTAEETAPIPLGPTRHTLTLHRTASLGTAHLRGPTAVTFSFVLTAPWVGPPATGPDDSAQQRIALVSDQTGERAELTWYPQASGDSLTLPVTTATSSGAPLHPITVQCDRDQPCEAGVSVEVQVVAAAGLTGYESQLTLDAYASVDGHLSDPGGPLTLRESAQP